MEERFGFIHEKLDIKILILFVLRRLPDEVDRDTLADIVQCDGGIGYFDFSDCLYELIDRELVTENHIGFRVTPKGANAGEAVESSLPYTVRKKAEKLIVPVAAELKKRSLLTAKHTEKDGKIFVKLAAPDKLGIDVLCTDEKQAMRIEKNFKYNSDKLYAQLIELFDKQA